MDKSAFQLSKNNSRTNANRRLHDTPIIQYGRVTKVIDIQTVTVKTIVQTSLSKEIYTVTLLNLSSGLLEISDYPKIGDTVLLLFLQKHDPAMFIQEEIYNPNAAGYNKFSGAGVLMSTAKNCANTVLSFYEDDGVAKANLKTDAEVSGVFNNTVALHFCRAVFDSEDEQLIYVLFGEGRPLVEKHLARTEKEYGFWKDADGEWVELDAGVSKKYSRYAPIEKDIQGAQTTVVGLGLSNAKEGAKPVETDSPITETIHGKSPVTRDIRSPQTLTVGIGNAETEDDAEERDAAVTETYGSKAPITKDMRGTQTYKIGTGPDGPTDANISAALDEKADITLESKSGFSGKFKREVKIESEESEVDIKSHDPAGLEGTGTQLGGDVLQVFWDDVIKTAMQYPMIIPPIPWPKYVPVPPVPPVMNMAANGFVKEIITIAKKAKSNCAKALK